MAKLKIYKTGLGGVIISRSHTEIHQSVEIKKEELSDLRNFLISVIKGHR
jgi:hypothetical protein